MVEDGICNATTNYGYDVLGGRASVAHPGYDVSCPSLPPAMNPATFIYDSLSRLQTATNAEGASITYSYSNYDALGQPGAGTQTTNARRIRSLR